MHRTEMPLVRMAWPVSSESLTQREWQGMTCDHCKTDYLVNWQCPIDGKWFCQLCKAFHFEAHLFSETRGANG